ncbi:hypothetical protein [Salipiger thiooxidans]|uniref:hypothetical protein n=1 Tax=Salipiger thiooxidans TaxID=282683 RepID=UPI001CD55A3C|nr:hypothetical protein [Salipiger thiooxidans]MCA0851196.1 hypothetical protein [Salipiger thiooxidans]
MMQVREMGRKAQPVPAHRGLPSDLSKVSDADLKLAWHSAATDGAPGAYEKIRVEIARRHRASGDTALARRAGLSYGAARLVVARS